MYIEVLSREQYDVVKVFSKKFRSFLEKCPLNVVFNTLGGKVLVTVINPVGTLEKDKQCITKEYDLDFSKDAANNVFAIRQDLWEYFPVFTTLTSRKFSGVSPKQVYDLMQEGMSLEEAVGFREVDLEMNIYRLEKLFHFENNIFLRDLKENMSEVYHLDYPISVWFSDLVGGRTAEAVELFQSSALLVKRIDSRGEVKYTHPKEAIREREYQQQRGYRQSEFTYT